MLTTNKLAMRFSDSASAEMMERIKLIKNMILFYVGAVATLLGVVFGFTGNVRLVIYFYQSDKSELTR